MKNHTGHALERVDHVVQLQIELALAGERIRDRAVIDTAVFNAHDLIADAIAQKAHGQVARLEGKGCVVGAGLMLSLIHI